ncbi:MAG TPA: hypothetical protein VIV60_25480, partial [Polyangiaceae bacterium]
MSRPPRPYPATEVSSGLPIKDGRLQVFAPTYLDLVNVETDLSLAELGQLSPGGEGDFANTLFGLSGVVAHVLGVYQDFYGGEAFIGTAQTEQSLVRHGRRVGYTTDPGVAATGVIAIDVKAGLSGDLAAGLPLLSVPKGEQGTENYETLEARHVDSNWNAIQIVDKTKLLPKTSLRALVIGPIEVAQSGLGLLPGEFVVVTPKDGDTSTNQFPPIVLTVKSATDDPRLNTTTLVLHAVSGVTDGDLETPIALGDVRLLAKPKLDLRLFGWNADANIFPPDKLRSSGVLDESELVDPDTTPITTVGTVTTASNTIYGYEVFAPAGGSGDSTKDLYLDQALRDDIKGQWAVRLQEGTTAPQAFFVTHQNSLSVTFLRKFTQFTQVKATETSAVMTSTQEVPQWISASTTRITVSDGPFSTTDTSRRDHDIRSRWLAGWQHDLTLVTSGPNDEELSKTT